jgi:hypothetical protein
VGYEARVRLPHTDLVVGRIGLGSSFGVGPEGLGEILIHINNKS